MTTASSSSAGAGGQSGARHAPADGERVLALDGLRGIAILLVLVGHLTEAGNALFGGEAHGVDRATIIVSSWGWTGVDLFFVLSGFLITGILFDAKAGGGYFRTFYARRVLRIFPLYYGYLALAFLVLPALPALEWAAPFRHQIWYWAYIQDLPATLRKGIDEYPFHAPVGHLWSLAIEEQFYLVWPAVVLAFGRRRLMTICAGCIAASLIFRVALIALHVDGAANYSLLPGRMGSLAVGAAIALAARSESDFAALRRVTIPLGAVSLTGVLAIIAVRHGFDAGDPYVQSAGYLLLGVLFGALVVGAISGLTGSTLQAIYVSPVLRALGRYSYGLYVLQGIVIIFVASRFDAVGDAPLIGGSRLPIIAAFSVITGMLMFVVAWLSWHGFENQILKFKRYFPRYNAEVQAPPLHQPAELRSRA